MHVLLKSFRYKISNDIVISSKRDRNEAAVVMQINFTELKSEINASQSLKKKYWWYSIQFHDISTQLEPWYFDDNILIFWTMKNSNEQEIISKI